MRRYAKGFAMLLAIFLLVGCSTADDQVVDEPVEQQEQLDESTGEDTRVVKDILEKEVTVPSKIESMVVGPIPYPAYIYALQGHVDNIVGIHPTTQKQYESTTLKDLAPELGDVSVEYVAPDFSMNPEELLNLDPDVVIVWSHLDDLIEKLEAVDIPVVTLTVGASSNMEDMYDNMRVLGDLLNEIDKAEEIIATIKEQEEFVVSRVEDIEDRPRVLSIRNNELEVYGDDSFQGNMIEMTGGINVATDLGAPVAEVQAEEILNWNPEIIYLGNWGDFTPEDLYENNIGTIDWTQIDAVKNNRVYKIPRGIYLWDPPTPETGLFMKWMAQLNHPEEFEDVDVVQEMEDFYHEIYGVDLIENPINQ